MPRTLTAPGVVTLVMLLVPLPAYAAVCFRSLSTDTARTDNIKVTLAGSGEEFFALVGEAVRVSCSGSVNSGSGTIDIPSNDTFGTTTFSAISCPTLPADVTTARPDR